MRVVVLGCGTGVGKTRLSVALLRALVGRGLPALGLKPIESGIEIDAKIERADTHAAPSGSDAAALALAGSVQTQLRHPLYALRAPVSPHLAARTSGIQIDVQLVVDWVAKAESLVTPHVVPHRSLWTIVETAGGVFSPLAPGVSNFELAQALEPALWLLVAADSLGVLHDVSSASRAMRACGREPDHLVLSGAREPDASSGNNAAELATLGIATPSAVLARNDDRGVDALVERLLETQPRPGPYTR
ncbi:MAG TPA: dethiobiotin synthase [Polyangiaceae bacterium]|nr:dethiobiotin synthase [Polyangiaceae bacterium]